MFGSSVEQQQLHHGPVLVLVLLLHQQVFQVQKDITGDPEHLSPGSVRRQIFILVFLSRSSVSTLLLGREGGGVEAPSGA